jgi:hypothetical protein
VSGILIEINFDGRRNFWSIWSKVTEIPILISGPTSKFRRNQNESSSVFRFRGK